MRYVGSDCDNCDNCNNCEIVIIAMIAIIAIIQVGFKCANIAVSYIMQDSGTPLKGP